MGLLRFLSGKTPEDIEISGDKLFRAEEFGAAKIEYEKALRKAENKFPEKESLIKRLNEKIRDARNALARAHLYHSNQLLESGSVDDAAELLQLALELTSDPEMKDEIISLIQKMGGHAEKNRSAEKNTMEDENFYPPDPEAGSTLDGIGDDEEYFTVLINTLPEDVRDAYQGYSRTFKQGYIALNNGDFEEAVRKLTRAMQDTDREQPLIPLELSTALINLEKYDAARQLLQQYLVENPDDMKAYQGLCDLFWITKEYAAATEMLEQCPDPLKETLPMKILVGETLYQAGQYTEAETVFSACENKFGANEIVSRGLAKTYEAMEDPEKARDIYARIISGCTTCGVRTDPFIQQRYAELCFVCGERSERLLNLYLSIMRDDPDNKESYYQRVYELYDALGNYAEADRYKAFIQ